MLEHKVDVSVIIVNYNTFELTSKCISSVLAKTNGISFEVILVDNASAECDPRLFKEKFPSIKVIASKENGGFAKGNNLGIKQAVGRYILLLNSDTELLNNAIKLSWDFMQKDQGVGLMTCQLHNPGNKIQKNCRRFRTIGWELLEVFPIHRFWNKNKREEVMLHHYFDHDRTIECDWVSGAYMFFKSDIVDQLPGKKLAEDYFMYCEDVLWCWQIKKLGYSIWFTPEPKVLHIHHGTVNKEKQIRIRKTIIRNHLDFIRRYVYDGWKFQIFRIIFLIKQSVISIIE